MAISMDMASQLAPDLLRDKIVIQPLSDQHITELAVSGETAGGGLRVAETARMNERELRKAVRKLCGKYM